MIFNQEPLRYETVTKLGLIPMEGGTRSYVLRSSFKVKNVEGKNGEISQLWCKLLIFTQGDGKFFMPPIVVHQSKDYSQDTHFKILLDWIIHHKPSRYIDRDEWLKYINQFSNIWVPPPCQKPDTFLRCTWQSLWWPRTNTNEVPTHPTIFTEIRRLNQWPDQW